MKIDKDSWHFRLTDKLIYGTNLASKIKYSMVSLCPYFWAVVWSLFMAGVVIPIAGLGIITFLLIPFWWMFANVPLGIAIIAGLLDIMMLVCFWVTYRRANFDTFFPQRISKVAKKVCKRKRKSLLYQWLKAKHLQICPILELEE